jgi:hypothetical protein
VQVGTSSISPITRGTDYAFISEVTRESAPTRTFAYRSGSSRRPIARSRSDPRARGVDRSPSPRKWRRTARSLCSCPSAADSGGNEGLLACSGSGRLRTSHFTVLSLRSGLMVPQPKCFLDVQEHLVAVAVLADRETRSHLPTDSESRARRDRDREASLSVHVSGDVRREIRQVTALRARVLLRP